MSQVLVWKSDQDGKLFEDKSKYQKHLRKLAAARREEKRLKLYEVEREQFFDRMGQVGSFDELQQFIIDNWSQFRTNAYSRNAWRKLKHTSRIDNLKSLALSSLNFGPACSNSHTSPRQGIECWDTRANRNKGKPTSYPGWRGRITYSVDKSSSFGSEYFSGTPICTGSGGGSDESLSYDLTLWAADFPVIWEKHCREVWVMRENQERMHVWRAVGGQGLCVPATEADIPADWVVPDPLESTSFAPGGY